MSLDRRRFLLSAALTTALGSLPASIARALDIPAKPATGTVMDVEHVVILTQENRSFDHYFGTLRGVRGFGDRFAIPVADTATRKDATVWAQGDEHDAAHLIAPFHLNTQQHFEYIRVTGTPHTFPDAQAAWDNGRMGNWPAAKHNHSLGYYTRDDLPFQFALAEAFTLCDAYHCSMHAGTNPNRTMLWTGSIDAAGQRHGPVIDNGYDHLSADPLGHGGYEWATYPERLTAAGISWQIYQNMDDNFTDNPMAGFKLYRFADKAAGGPLAELARRALRTRDLDTLKADVLAGTLPQVSWIIATAEGSEHPGPSSPAQGADYTARVLDALTANPAIWGKTVFLLNFDENDGFFDHAPPPSPTAFDEKDPSKRRGVDQIDTRDEYHITGKDAYLNRPYGLGPRVPMYVISPWSKGGFVNSQVFDHTSVIRFLEARFGVHEPNLSPWRRAVCGDLMSCFDFQTPNRDDVFAHLPDTKPTAERARKLLITATPATPDVMEIPVQEQGLRPARPLPYDLSASARITADGVLINLTNQSQDTACVFHLHDRHDLASPPRRYTLKAGGSLSDLIPLNKGRYDLVLSGPNGFHRRFEGHGPCPITAERGGLTLILSNLSDQEVSLVLSDEAYGQPPQNLKVDAKALKTLTFDLNASHNWYDISLKGDGFYHRFAGHVETGAASMSDPALGGPAIMKITKNA